MAVGQWEGICWRQSAASLSQQARRLGSGASYDGANSPNGEPHQGEDRRIIHGAGGIQTMDPGVSALQIPPTASWIVQREESVRRGWVGLGGWRAAKLQAIIPSMCV